MILSLAELEDRWTDEQVPVADRRGVDTSWLSTNQLVWRHNGWLAAPGLVPDELIDAYADEWRAHHTTRVGTMDGRVMFVPKGTGQRGGWNYATPHRDHRALRDLVCSVGIADVLTELLDEPAGVHLTLTGWQTTTRDWHADQYLNPPHVGGYYAAVWIALDDIHPDSGPFQFIPGSHLWPPLSQTAVRKALGDDGHGSDWPTHSERILTPLYEQKIDRAGIEPVTWLPKRGDVLFWHSRLVHRGSVAKIASMERRAVIAHASGIHHRQDMPPAYRTGGGWCFPIDDGERWT